jgi:hypothetical protein
VVARPYNEPAPPIQPVHTGTLRSRRLRDALVAKGWKPGTDLQYLEQENGHHDEVSWASRVEPMLRFLYGRTPAKP